MISDLQADACCVDYYIVQKKYEKAFKRLSEAWIRTHEYARIGEWSEIARQVCLDGLSELHERICRERGEEKRRRELEAMSDETDDEDEDQQVVIAEKHVRSVRDGCTVRHTNNTRLPEDIIVAIGVHAMDTNPNIAVVLAGVCRFWRETVCSQPFLWSRLFLGLINPGAKTALWRARSRSRVIHLTFSKEFDLQRNVELLEILGDLTRYVRYLDSPGVPCPGKELRDRFPSLEILRVSDPMPIQAEGLELDHLPITLRHLHVRRIDLHSSSDFALDNITVLDLQVTSFPLRLLRRLPNLKQLSICGCGVLGGNDPVPEDATAIALDRVRQYRCVGNVFEFPTPLMTTLFELDLHGSWDRLSQWTSVALGSICLVALDLGRTAVDEEELVSTLPSLKFLRFLGVAKTGITDATVKCLTAGNAMWNETRVCPYLVAISLSKTRVTTPAVLKMVNSRLPAKKRIAYQPSTTNAAGASEASKPLGGSDPECKRIKWLCLEECDYVDPSIIPLLRRRVAFVGDCAEKMNADEVKQTGAYDWKRYM